MYIELDCNRVGYLDKVRYPSPYRHMGANWLFSTSLVAVYAASLCYLKLSAFRRSSKGMVSLESDDDFEQEKKVAESFESR